MRGQRRKSQRTRSNLLSPCRQSPAISGDNDAGCSLRKPCSSQPATPASELQPPWPSSNPQVPGARLAQHLSTPCFLCFCLVYSHLTCTSQLNGASSRKPFFTSWRKSETPTAYSCRTCSFLHSPSQFAILLSFFVINAHLPRFDCKRNAGWDPHLCCIPSWQPHTCMAHDDFLKIIARVLCSTYTCFSHLLYFSSFTEIIIDI